MTPTHVLIPIESWESISADAKFGVYTSPVENHVKLDLSPTSIEAAAKKAATGLYATIPGSFCKGFHKAIEHITNPKP